MFKLKKILSIGLCTGLCAFTLIACSKQAGTTPTTMPDKEKVFNYGTSSYGEAMGTAGLDPHNGYMGWSAVRYGVGETLFKFSKTMDVEPWLATKYEQPDPSTIKIYLRDDVTFSNGKKMTGEKVKACLDNLAAKHDRAPKDLQIKDIRADGQTVTITSKSKVPSLINYLSDPYGAIIDMEAGVSADKIVVGTGPYIAKQLTPTAINLEANMNYWGEKPKVNKVNIKSITDGDTLTLSLQKGEIDASQGLPYASLDLFKTDKYKISSADTSRLYMAAFNFKTNELKDLKVRKAISMAVDKEGFTKTLLNGNGTPAVGAYPSNFAFGNQKVTAPKYDIEAAKNLLKEAGYTKTNSQGYVEKDGKALTIRWLTYPSRQELPLLAGSVQASLKKIGIKVNVNSTDNYKDFLKRGEYDVYASAFVAAPTGDPQYYVTTHLLDSSSYNRGSYHSDKIEQLAANLREEFDKDKRAQLAIQIQQQVLDDAAYIYASHLKLSFVMKSNVSGFESHPSDYYEITSKLDIN